MERDHEAVYKLVSLIPKGKVSTYGTIAKQLGMHPRAVGMVLHKNKDKNVPCHRVVRAKGSVGGYNKGIDEKIKLLSLEGIKIDRKYNILDFESKLFKDFKDPEIFLLRSCSL
ncbi:MAG TPA: MGMT family protein [Thermoplasmata archaeon]|nr:MGMT family protein [Thermoplasmata archaeon]